MMISLKRRGAWLAACAALAFCAGGCAEDHTRPPWRPAPSPYKKQTSPENVLFNLQLAYERREVAAYDSVLYDVRTAMDTLSTEAFSFWFAREDVEQGGPPNWPRNEEMLSATRMMTSADVQDVSSRLTFGPSYDDTSGHAGQKVIDVTDVYLAVTESAAGGSSVTYLVQGQRAEFRFKVQWVDARGDSLWRIVYWKDWADGPGKGRMVEHGTWGRIKWMFLH